MISSVIGMSLRKVWHLCNLHFVYALFRPIFYKLKDFLISTFVFTFAELNMRFTMTVLLICILYCDAGSGCLIRTFWKYSILILIMDNIFVLVRYSSVTP